MQLQRYIDIEKELMPGKALVLLGPRRSGKTTLLKSFMATTKTKFVHYVGDSLSVQNDFAYTETDNLRKLVGDNQVLIIDEAQMIPNIGRSLKLLVDVMPEVTVVVTGSSAFELSGQIGEPLTGRKRTSYILPMSVSELVGESRTPEHDLSKALPNLLVYGMYPSSVTAKNDDQKREFLQELVDSYLLKDILEFQQVKGSRILLQLLNLLAYQVGGEVSATEIGGNLRIDRKTVERYLDLLEKAFIIFRLGGLSRNMRSEVTRKPKYYFYDLGVRNAVIGNFNPLEIRNDIGQLWENFAVVERLKKRSYYGPHANQYFWRTWKGSEIDLVEERDGKYFGYEMKWNTKKAVLAPKEWLANYGDQVEWELITPERFLAFVGGSAESESSKRFKK
ncbi:MAG: ATP-binding protein [Patescibacteria group bacterium]